MTKLAVLIAAALSSILIAACGGSSEDTESAPRDVTTEESAAGEQRSDGVILFEADPGGGLAYTADEVNASAGKAKVEFVNSSPASHDLAIEDSGGKTIVKTEVLAEGSDSAATDLRPGTYVFYCSLPGHRQGGMEGTLKVE